MSDSESVETIGSDTCGVNRQCTAYFEIECGKVEYETLTRCGEYADCFDECHKSWAFCPYCGKPIKKNASDQRRKTAGSDCSENPDVGKD